MTCVAGRKLLDKLDNASSTINNEYFATIYIKNRLFCLIQFLRRVYITECLIGSVKSVLIEEAGPLIRVDYRRWVSSILLN